MLLHCAPEHRLHPNSRFCSHQIQTLCKPEGSQNRLFCVHLKVSVAQETAPFEPPADPGRYNTLDFALQNRVPKGAFTPVGNPEGKEPAVPLQSQPFCNLYIQTGKTVFASPYPKTKKSPQSILWSGEERLWGFSMPHS